MNKVLKRGFFERDSHRVAKDLLGHFLCRRLDGKIVRTVITEVEVYDGSDDRASHAFGKKPNHRRTRHMFGPAGVWYVYLCYGMHWLINVVTREPGHPAAILIRGTAD